MGVDISTYRLRIGTFSCRGGGRRRTTSKTYLSNPAKLGGYHSHWCFLGSEEREPLRGSGLLKISRPQAKACLLATVLVVSSLLACVAQPGSTPRSLHDLSPLLLLVGDIEENPGPSTAVQTEPEQHGKTQEAAYQEPGYSQQEANTTYWEKRIRTLEHKMNKKMKRMDKELKRQKDFTDRLANLCEHDSRILFEEQNQMKRNTQDLERNLNGFIDDVENKLRMAEEQTDNQEKVLKRNNIKLFGVPEREREPYRECLQTILQLFREVAPGAPWSEKDIIKVQRLGKRRNFGNWNQPRPLLVEITTFFDKLILLKYGREGLRNKGIRITSELTTRQAKILQDLREEGHDAYYRNNKLWFRDNRRFPRSATGTTNRGITDSRNQQWHAPRTSSYMQGHHEHYSEDIQAWHEAQQQPVYPQYQQRQDRVDTGGTWDYPPGFPSSQHRHFETSTESHHMAQARQPRAAPGDANGVRFHSGGEPTDKRKDTGAPQTPFNIGKRRLALWAELREDFPTDVYRLDSSECDSSSLLEGSMDDLSTTGSSLQDSWHEASLGARQRPQLEDMCTVRSQIPRDSHEATPVTTQEGNEGPQVNQPNQCSEHLHPKTPRTVLEWLTKTPVGGTPARVSPAEVAPEEATSQDARDHEDAEEATPSWRGRLRQRQTSPHRNDAPNQND